MPIAFFTKSEVASLNEFVEKFRQASAGKIKIVFYEGARGRRGEAKARADRTEYFLTHKCGIRAADVWISSVESRDRPGVELHLFRNGGHSDLVKLPEIRESFSAGSRVPSKPKAHNPNHLDVANRSTTNTPEPSSYKDWKRLHSHGPDLGVEVIEEPVLAGELVLRAVCIEGHFFAQEWTGSHWQVGGSFEALRSGRPLSAEELSSRGISSRGTQK